jgi:hypothetical protein
MPAVTSPPPHDAEKAETDCLAVRNDDEEVGTEVNFGVAFPGELCLLTKSNLQKKSRLRRDKPQAGLQEADGGGIVSDRQ